MTTLEEVSKRLQECRITCDMRSYGRAFQLKELILYTDPEIVITFSDDVVCAIKGGCASIYGVDLVFDKLESGVVIYVYDEYSYNIGQLIGGRL